MASYTAYESIDVDVADGVATIEIRRPDVHNAMNDDVMLDLRRAFDEIQLDRSVDIVVVTGRGEEAFSAGADIAEYAGPADDHDPCQKDRQELFYEMYRKPFDCHAPVVAKIGGYCVGGGLIFAMYCDLRIATEGSAFGVPTANIGQIPTGNSTWRAIELVGEAKAKELVYTAGLIDADEAERIGLVNRVVPGEELDEAVDGIVDAVQDTGRQAVKNSKRALNHASRASTAQEAREFEADCWWEQFATDERRRLVDEFTEGR